MNSTYPLLLFVHLIAVVVWVGGMFFAYVCLRPVAAEQLEPPMRLTLWAGVFGRFFPWVWAAVCVILASGLTMILFHGMSGAPVFMHLMLATGLVMVAVYIHLYLDPYARLRQGVAAGDWSRAGAALNQIRKLVGFNLVLGLITIVIAKLGVYLQF